MAWAFSAPEASGHIPAFLPHLPKKGQDAPSSRSRRFGIIGFLSAFLE